MVFVYQEFLLFSVPEQRPPTLSCPSWVPPPHPAPPSPSIGPTGFRGALAIHLLVYQLFI
jgi:hypothetical protein